MNRRGIGMKLQPELSKKNKYYISKHRYYELKHFCMQYGEWVKEYIDIYGPHCKDLINTVYGVSNETSVTEEQAIRANEISRKMNLIIKAAYYADADMQDKIIIAVTKGLSYDTMVTRYDIPCGKDYWYDRIRKFYWNLSNSRM